MNKYGGLILGAWLGLLSPLALAANADGANPTSAADTPTKAQAGATAETAADATATASTTSGAAAAVAESNADAQADAQAESQPSTGDTETATAATSAEEATRQQAREALKQKKTDVSSKKNLEEVFEAAQKQYSLLASGKMDMTLSGSYSYYGSDTIDINIGDGGSINRFQIQHNAQHSFGMALSISYGIWDNLTFNGYLPVSYEYDTQKDANKASLGDISFGLRFQPFPVVPGGINTTLYTTFSTATGDSPFEINPNTEVSGGKGYYSIGGGVSMSKVIDPVVLFGSVGFTHGFDATGLNQRRGDGVLKRVKPGDSLNFSFGLAYSLSYDVSISGSYQQSYNFPSRFTFEKAAGKTTVKSQDSTSAVMNMSLGLRTTDNNIVNVNFGFGLTRNSPDVLLGFSIPVNIAGLKTGS